MRLLSDLFTLTLGVVSDSPAAAKVSAALKAVRFDAKVPPTIKPLDPFQSSTAFNINENFTGFPQLWLYCSDIQQPMSTEDIDDLVKRDFLDSTVNLGMVPNRTGWLWAPPADGPRSQIYICNYNPQYYYSISVQTYKMVDRWLDKQCGEAFGGYVYFDRPWDVAIGRDSTNPDGSLRNECDKEWPAGSG